MMEPMELFTPWTGGWLQGEETPEARKERLREEEYERREIERRKRESGTLAGKVHHRKLIVLLTGPAGRIWLEETQRTTLPARTGYEERQRRHNEEYKEQLEAAPSMPALYGGPVIRKYRWCFVPH
jgi:hypothetical protein